MSERIETELESVARNWQADWVEVHDALNKAMVRLAKIGASRDGLEADNAALRERNSQLEGELAGISLMDAEAEAQLPDVLRQLQEALAAAERQRDQYRAALEAAGVEI